MKQMRPAEAGAYLLSARNRQRFGQSNRLIREQRGNRFPSPRGEGERHTIIFPD